MIQSSTGSGAGIIAHGAIEAPITIEHAVVYANIIGAKIAAPIVIGKLLKGAVVAFGTDTATDPDDGTIASIVVGRGQWTFDPFQQMHRGMSGAAEVPGLHDMSPFDLWNDPQPMRPVWLNRGSGDTGAIDCVIRAERRIGTVDVASMSREWLQGSQLKRHRPRIEAPRIDTLIVGTMGPGVVWSGRLEYAQDELEQWRVQNDPANDYAEIGSATIGCVSPESDVWLKSCPLLEITGDLLGELHLPALNAGETIRIGGAMSDVALGTCGCLPASGGGGGDACTYLGVLERELSPRGIPSYSGEAPDGIATRSAIFIADPEGLNGQIIVDAARTDAMPGQQRPETHLRGFVRIGGVTLETAAPDPAHRLPSYTAPSAEFSAQARGGAVGLAPFAVYPDDSLPRRPQGSASPGIYRLDQYLTGTLPVVVRYYGPLAYAGSGPAVLVQRLVTGTNGGWLDVTSEFEQSVAGAERSISLLPANGGAGIVAGFYRTSPIFRQVWCANVATADPLPLLFSPGDDSTYFHFRLGCAVGGNVNPADIATEGSSDPTSGPDGFLTGTDFDVFLVAFFGELRWTNGILIADLTDDTGTGGPDGFLTGADFDVFIANFFAGCDSD